LHAKKIQHLAIVLRMAPTSKALHPDPFLVILQALHQTSLDNLRAASKATRTLCATWMDTLGPEIVVANR
jgi:hypothetical protein